MRTSSRFFLALMTCLSLVTPGLQATPASTTAQHEAVQQKLSGMQIPFIENKGQVDKSVAFYAPTFAGTVFVTKKGELVYALPANGAANESDTRSMQVLTERLIAGKAVPAPLTAATTKVSYFLGNDKSKWQRDVSTNSAVSLGEVWKGIDVELHAYGKNVEKFFTVRPGASVDTIQVQLDGAESLKISQDGALDVTTESGVVRFTPPVAWQEKDGQKLPVQVAYLVKDDTYSFKLGQHDAALPVVIDPLLQSTYLGGSSTDTIPAIAIHPVSGDVYVSGATLSINFPGVTGGVQTQIAGDINLANADFFIARLNSDLTVLIQATYLGGSGSDSATALAIHPLTGDVYVAGQVTSNDLPGVIGGAQTTRVGVNDAYIARLNSGLTSLIQATYLGGGALSTSALEINPTLRIHPLSGEIYVAGTTSATDFPGTAGGAQAVFGGSKPSSPYTLYIARLKSDLTTLYQSTYLGESIVVSIPSLAIHSTTGDVYVAGQTHSSAFPSTTGGAQEARANLLDCFIARINSDLTTLIQSTYLGGLSDEGRATLAIHPATGDVYLSGKTNSPNFPGTSGGAQALRIAGPEGFVSRLNSSLTTLIQSTFLGGNLLDAGGSIAIHPVSGDIFVAGETTSAFLGTTGGAQEAFGGGEYDAFIARLNSNLTTLVQSTYLGGNATEYEFLGGGLAIHPLSGQVYVAGYTDSNNFPGSAGGAQTVAGGASDIYIARLTPSLALNDYTLTATQVGAGTVSTSDGLINCGGDCSEIYGNNQVVTLSAIPNAGSTFTGWAGACSNTTGDCVVTMDADKTATANYTAPFSLTVSKVGGGAGAVTSSDGGINCGADCAENYASNTVVTLTATAETGSKFALWTGACSGSLKTCSVTMDAVKSVTAKFNRTR